MIRVLVSLLTNLAVIESQQLNNDIAHYHSLPNQIFSRPFGNGTVLEGHFLNGKSWQALAPFDQMPLVQTAQQRPYKLDQAWVSEDVPSELVPTCIQINAPANEYIAGFNATDNVRKFVRFEPGSHCVPNEPYCYSRSTYSVHCRYNAELGEAVSCRNSNNERLMVKDNANPLETTSIDVHQTVRVIAIYNRITHKTLVYLPLSEPMIVTIGNQQIAAESNQNWSKAKIEEFKADKIDTIWSVHNKHYIEKVYRTGDIDKSQGRPSMVNSIEHMPSQINNDELPVLREPILIQSDTSTKHITIYTSANINENELTVYWELDGKQYVSNEKDVKGKKRALIKLVFIGLLTVIVGLAIYQALPWWYYLRHPNELLYETIDRLYRWKRKRRNTDSMESETGDTELSATASSASLMSTKYTREYETVRILGKGGFGLVFQARRLGDNQQLAVKRIKVKNQNHKQKIWREALLHRLLQNYDVEFTHLIQYYDAWEEYCLGADIKQHDAEYVRQFNHEHLEQDTELITTLDDSTTNTESAMSKSLRREVSFAIERDSGSCNATVDSWGGSQTWSSSSAEEEEAEMTKSESDGSTATENSLSAMTSPESGLFLRWNNSSVEDSVDEVTASDETTDEIKDNYIYVVSQLCQPETLKNKLASRADVDPFDSKRIFIQICKGVQVLHGLKFIHRDLKPANVFFSRDRQNVKIGDFGLMTTSLHQSESEADLKSCMNTELPNRGDIPLDIPLCSMTGLSDDSMIRRHTSQIGTRMYMAPEIMKHGNYSLPVDIYSLGIILFELFTVFTSRMDRGLQIRDAKGGSFQPHIERYRGVPELVRVMLKPESQHRPSIQEVLTAAEKLLS